MAESTSTPSTSNNAGAVAYLSCFQRTVCLYDWWLVKAETDFQGKRLAISGITSRKEEALRVFISAPITKRHDVLSLETADGIYIIIKGFINEQRTLENGFPPEVLNSFVFGFPPNWESYATDFFRDESTIGIDSGSAVPENVSAVDPEILSDDVEKSIPSLKSPEEALGSHVKPFPEVECYVSKEATRGVNVAHGCGSLRRSTRLRNIKVCQQKEPTFGVASKHPDKEQHSSSGALENPDGEGLISPVTNVLSQSLGQVNRSSEQLVETYAAAIDPEILSNGVGKSVPTSSKSPEEALGAHKKSFPEDECHVSMETTHGVNVGCGSYRRTTRSRNIKVCQQKKPASGVSLKHPDTEQHSSLGALENPAGQGLNSPVTPVQLQSMRKVNTPSEQLVKNSASRVSRTLSENREGCSKKKQATVETKVITRKRQMARSASAIKYPRARDVSPLIMGGKENISSVSPLSSSFKKSRSGRLLVPPLEFWRNQIPIYNADHEITEIQGGASVVSPFKGSSASLSRFNNNRKRAA